MTATAAVLPAAAPRATPSSEPRDAASHAGKFDQQLDAARQKQASPHSDDSKKALSSDHADSDAKHAPASTAAASTRSAEARSQASTTAKDADDDTLADGDTSAGALASAMLAMLAPATSALRPLAAGIAAAKVDVGGKSVASDASAAALLKMNTAAAGANANPATLDTALPAAAEGLLAASQTKSAAVDKPGDATAQPAAALSLPGASTNATQSVHQLQITTPAGSHGFAQELGQQVAWLGAQDVKEARIRLHPEDLGQLDIKVSVNHGRVDVVFNAQHPGAVTAVQQSLPQLDQMLGQHGLSLGHSEVGQQAHGGSGGGEGQASESGGIDEIGDVHAVVASTGTVSLLDAFA